MNINMRKTNSFGGKKNKLCSSCNNYFYPEEFNEHKDKCNPFKQSYRGFQSNLENNSNNSNNLLNANVANLANLANMNANPFIRISDPNQQSFKATIRDSKEKVSEDDHIDKDRLVDFNDGVVTFGARSSKSNTSNNTSNNTNYNTNNNTNYNTNYSKYDTNQHFASVKELDEEQYTNNKHHNNNPLRESNSNSNKQYVPVHGITSSPQVGVINNFGDHNSFLSVIVHCLYSMSKLRNCVVFDLSLSESDLKSALLFNLQSVLKKTQLILSKHKEKQNALELLSIKDLRKCLSESFQSRRKFVNEQPDDPVDVFFSLINSLHSYSIKSALNELNDSSCNGKCLAHKFFFMDLYRIDECECKGTSKRLYSYHNYVFDIPMNKILKLVNCNDDLKGKMFFLFKNLIAEVKSNCPEKGIRCSINKTHKKFYIANTPTYLTFNIKNHTLLNLTDILKTFLLIPKIFDLSSVFIPQDRNKYLYELTGFVLVGANKNFTCFNKDKVLQGNSWVYHDDEKVEVFSNWNGIISFCLKNSLTPIMLFYQLISENSYDKNSECESGSISVEEMAKLERFCRNIDNMSNVLQNQFRPNEEIIKFNDDEENSRNDRNSRNDHVRYINKVKDKSETVKDIVKDNVKNIDNKNIDNNSPSLNKFKRSPEKEITNIPIKDLNTNNGIIGTNLNRHFSKGSLGRIDDKNASIKIPNKNEEANINKLNTNNNNNNNNPASISLNVNIMRQSSKDKDRHVNNPNETNLPKQMNPKKNNLVESKENKGTSISNTNTNTKVTIKNVVDKNNIKIKEESKNAQAVQTWKCILCGYTNKLPDYKCQNCSKKNDEVNEKLAINNNNSNKVGNPNPNPNLNLHLNINIPKPNTNNNNVQSLIRKESNSKLHKENSSPAVNHIHNSKTDFYKSDKDDKSNNNHNNNHNSNNQVQCLCYKFEEDKVHTIFNNNICRICGRTRGDNRTNNSKRAEVVSNANVNANNYFNVPKPENQNPLKRSTENSSNQITNKLSNNNNNNNNNNAKKPFDTPSLSKKLNIGLNFNNRVSEIYSKLKK